MTGVVFYDGKFTTFDLAQTQIEDRGNTFGDGVYDAVCCLNKKPLNMEKHLDRFFNSMKSIDIHCPYSKEKIEDIIFAALEKTDITNSLVYFQITRGSARRSHVYTDGMVGNFYLTVKEKPNYLQYRKCGGAPIISLIDDRWRRCDIKSLNLLANVLAAKKASQKRCIEALLIRDGVAAECTSSSIFYIKDDVIYTEPLSPLILDGINRRCVIAIAKSRGIKVVEKQSNLDAFYTADEVFMTSATKLILNVIRIDEKKLNKKHPISDMLFDAYIDEVEKQCGPVDRLSV
jgi:D-alanine transaminase